eukprot:6686266-Alexandrium_andersonii.AAC.1
MHGRSLSPRTLPAPWRLNTMVKSSALWLARQWPAGPRTASKKPSPGTCTRMAVATVPQQERP